MKLKELEKYLHDELNLLERCRLHLGMGYDYSLRKSDNQIFSSTFISLFLPFLQDTLYGAQALAEKNKFLSPALGEEAVVGEEIIKLVLPPVEEITKTMIAEKTRGNTEICFSLEDKAAIIDCIIRGIEFLDFKIGRNWLMQCAIKDMKYRTGINNLKRAISTGSYELGRFLSTMEETDYIRSYYKLPTLRNGGVMVYMIVDACEGSVLPKVLGEKDQELLLEEIPANGLRSYMPADAKKEIINILQSSSPIERSCQAELKKIRARKFRDKIKIYNEKMNRLISSDRKDYIV